jgi:hypothetical protein
MRFDCGGFMSEKHMCCERVWPSDAWSRSASCKKTAKVERGGKHYCGTHDPVARKEKKDARDAEMRKKIAEESRIGRIRHAAPELLEALQEAIAVIKRIKPPENGMGTIVRGEDAIRKATGEQP